MAKKKKRGLKWGFSVYDPYTDTQIVKIKNLSDDQFDLSIKEFRKKFK
jgi:hypothetical protein